MKKFAVMVTVLVALALPAVAGAAAITSSAGKLAPVGSTVTLTNLGFFEVQGINRPLTICSHYNFAMKLTQNNGTTVEASSAAAKPLSSECNDKTEQTVIATSIEITRFVAAPSGDTMSFKMVSDFPEVTCTMTGTNVPFSYVLGDSKINFATARPVTGTPAALCREFWIDGKFTLAIGGTPVILD
jgi:hypothetical protein